MWILDHVFLRQSSNGLQRAARAFGNVYIRLAPLNENADEGPVGGTGDSSKAFLRPVRIPRKRDVGTPVRGCRTQSRLPTMKLGAGLQRLFSTFPNDWPGVGLLLIRVCLGLAVLSFGLSDLPRTFSEPVALAQRVAGIVGGACLIVGLWTPVAGVLVAVKESQLGFFFRPEEAWVHLFLAVIAISVAMTGPGAWSLDARRFGRRRVEIGSSRSRRPLA